MLKSVKTAALMAFLAVPALAEQHEQVDVNEVVATVNGTEITLGPHDHDPRFAARSAASNCPTTCSGTASWTS